MSKSAPSSRSPKKTSSLDLHQQERTNQADATSIEGVCTGYSHTHSIIISSNVRAGEWEQSDGWMGLLERVEQFDENETKRRRRKDAQLAIDRESPTS